MTPGLRADPALPGRGGAGRAQPGEQPVEEFVLTVFGQVRTNLGCEVVHRRRSRHQRRAGRAPQRVGEAEPGGPPACPTPLSTRWWAMTWWP